MKKSKTEVYDFSYLDADLAEDYLSGIAGPVGYPVTSTERQGGKRGARAGLAVGPVELGGEIDTNRNSETQYWIRQQQSAAFYRLRHALQSQGRLDLMEEFDSDVWTQLREGQFVEVRGKVEVSPLDTFLHLATTMYDLGTSLGAIDPSDEGTRTAVQGIAILTQSGAKALSVFIYPAGAVPSKYRFFASLNKSKVLVPLDDLNARFHVLGRIRTVLERNEMVDLMKLPGNLRLPRDQVRDFVKKLGNAPFLDRQIRPSDLKVTAPGVEMSIVAIFR